MVIRQSKIGSLKFRFLGAEPDAFSKRGGSDKVTMISIDTKYQIGEYP